MITLSLNICSNLFQSFNYRNSKDILNRTIYAVASDLKYNIPFDDISSILEKGEKNYSLSLKTIGELADRSVFELSSTNSRESYIKLSLKSIDNLNILIQVQAKYYDLEIKEEILKSRWMDEE